MSRTARTGPVVLTGRQSGSFGPDRRTVRLLPSRVTNEEAAMKAWTVGDVMTKAVVSVKETASYRSVVDLLMSHRFSAVPVVDDFLRVTGVVSESDLLRKIEYAGGEEPRLFDGRRRRGERPKAKASTADSLMTSPPVVALSGTSIAAAARLMDSEGVKRLPVVDDLG